MESCPSIFTSQDAVDLPRLIACGFFLSGLVLGEFSGLGFEMPVSGLR